MKYAAILGATVSKGARSPHLWNAAFKAHGLPSEMRAIDVDSAGLDALLAKLDADPDFIGGAVAMPHKEAVAKWLEERLTPEAKRIGAVNCLFRGEGGRLHGTNTDGEGALSSFEERFGPVKGKSVVLLGLGGAGKAVAAFFAREARVTASSRSDRHDEAKRLGCVWEPWPPKLDAAQVLVNCTSVGAESPLPLKGLRGGAQVFDIIYNPSPTGLMREAARIGCETLDGSGMNLEQAVLGFARAAGEPKGRAVTREAMLAAKNALDRR